MRALKAFDYSHDGLNALHLEPGDDASDVPAECLPGLIAEGYVSGFGAVAAPVAIEQPAKTYPSLTPAQEEALDRVADGVIKPGGAPKGGNRRKKA